jgi:excisionase family DNA binding protein
LLRLLLTMKLSETDSQDAPATMSASYGTRLTPHEAAAHLHVGVDIIYDACAGRGLRHTKLGHRTIRIKREWVDAWAEEGATAVR